MERFALVGEVRAPDDVDVVADREAGEELEVALRELGDLAGGEARAGRLDQGHELGGEQLGEEDEVGLVVGGHVREVVALAGEVAEGPDPPQLVLDDADARGRRGPGGVLGLREMVEVRPLEVGRVAP